MSLYQLQKFLYQLNREPDLQTEFRARPDATLDRFDLTGEERGAISRGDIGLIFVLGSNGQLLMHFAAFMGIAWPDYLQAMRDGVAKYGPVRNGIYAMTTSPDEKVAGI